MKKFFVVLMVLAMSIVPVFAGDAIEISSGGQTLSFQSLSQIVVLCTGIIPGALIAIKFMIDIVSAYYHREQDPSKLQKAIVNFIIVVIIVVGYVVVVNFIFGDDANSTEGEYNSGRSNFLSGLSTSGAELPEGVDAPAMEFDLSGFSVEGVEDLL